MVGPKRFPRLLEPFEDLRRAGRVRHTLQTNGTSINDMWCTLFERYGIGVGVSIDGPRWANRGRRTLLRAETFNRTVKGIECLSRHGLDFTTISVVTFANLPKIIERADEFFDFFKTIGARQVGFNIEEQEGSHKVTAADDGLAWAFWRAIFDRWREAGGVPLLRDFDRVLGFAALSLAGVEDRRLVDPLPTVTHDGDVFLLSPELAGRTDERYGDFKVGNLYKEDLSSIIARGLEARYVEEFREGTEECHGSCPYFDYCQGGQASNRYFEHGDFQTNVTDFCRHSRQAPFDAVVGIDQNPNDPAGALT